MATMIQATDETYARRLIDLITRSGQRAVIGSVDDLEEQITGLIRADQMHDRASAAAQKEINNLRVANATWDLAYAELQQELRTWKLALSAACEEAA